MTYQAGSASVQIVPDLKDFHTQISEELDGLEGQFAEAGDKAGEAFGTAFQGQVKAALADLPDAKVGVDADTAELDAQLDEATKDRTAEVVADADTAAAGAKLDAVAAKKRTAKIDIVETLQKGGTLSDLLNPVGLGAAAGVALGPDAVGATAGIAGVGAAFAAAAADAGAFGVVAEGMFSAVTTSQTALTTAQKDYNSATTDAGRATALAAEKAALDGLTPSERALATELTALTTAWGNLEKAQQPVVGAALAPWLATATSGMQLLNPLITGGADAIKILGEDAETALQSPFWKTFSSTLGQTGQVALADFGQAAGKVGDGLAHLFDAFAPDIDKLPPIIDDLAGDFDHWAASVTDTGLNEFLSTTFSPSNLSALAADGKEVASFVENVATASKDMSPLAFTGLGNVLDIMGQLTPSEIEALTGLFLAVKAVGTGAQVYGAVSSAVSKVKGLLPGSSAGADTTAEGTAFGTETGEAAAGAFTATFTEQVVAALPKAFDEIGVAGVTEATALGTEMGAAAEKAFTAEFPSGTLPESSGTAGVSGSTAKDAEEDTEKDTAAKGAASDAEKDSGLLGKLGSVGAGIGAAAGVLSDAVPLVAGVLGAHAAVAAASSASATPGTAQGKAATSISQANSKLTGTSQDPADPLGIGAGFAGWAATTVPEIWSTVYTGFERDVGSPVAAWFTNSLPEAFDSAIPRLVWSPAFEGFMNDIGSPIAAWFDTSLPHFFDSAAGLVEGWGRDIGNDLVTGWDSAAGAVSAAFGSAETWVAGAFAGAAGWVAAVPGEIASSLVGAWNATESAVAGAFGAAKTWVAGEFADAATWLNATGGEIEGALVRGWNATESAVTGAFGAAKTWVTGEFSSAASWLEAVPGEIESALVKGWDATESAVTGEFAKTKTWVANEFSSAGTWLESAGKDIVNGLISGVESMGSTLETAIIDLIPSPVRSVVESALGIASPSTVFAEIGRNVGLGFIGGLDGMQSGVEQSAALLAASSLSGLGDLAAAQSLSALGALGLPSLGAAARLPGVTSPLTAGPLQLQVSYAGTGNQLTDTLVQSLQFKIIDATGGDVQAALGWGPVRIS